MPSPLSCVSAVSVEIITAYVETIQLQDLSVCLCYKCAANISSVWKINLSSGSVQHFEHKVQSLELSLLFVVHSVSRITSGNPAHDSFLWPGYVQFTAGYNSPVLLLCISYVVGVS